MSKITRQDTNGVKPLLATGEFGYDNYPTGGDSGRVYIGTGTENIGLAKRAEVWSVDGKADAHIARADNPHNVTKAQVGLSNVNNTSDLNKPISTATQTALNLKIDKVAGKQLSTEDYTTAEKTKLSGIESGAQVNTIMSVAGKTGIVTLAKGDVGLSNVDNTSDANKPISTATQNALNLKANAANVVLTGIPTAPTAAVGTNTTQLATTAFVNAEIANDAPSKTGNGASGTWAISVSGNATTVTNGVYTSDNQTIAGVKTFSSSPIVPTPTTDFQPTTARSTNITVNVGAGQTYTTINQALEYLSGFYPMYKQSGITATINLKAGFVMAEQVLVSGIDLGWITVVGEDAETIITHTALTTVFNGADYPAFGVDKGGTSPIIGQLFRFSVEKVGGNKHGLMVVGAGSSTNVLNGAGFIGAGANGIYADGSSTVNANAANCSNAGTFGIAAVATSTVNANAANCSNAGVYGIYAALSSTINAINAIVQNQTTGGARIVVQDGSTIEASAIDTTGGTVPVFNQPANTLTGNGIIYQ